MKWCLAILTVYSLSPIAKADSVFRIELGQDYKEYKDSDLKRRVWELERAVWQLQQKVFQMETSQNPSKSDSWLCQIKAVGDIFTGTGPTKGIAMERVIDKCKAGNNGNGFFCKDPKCEQ